MTATQETFLALSFIVHTVLSRTMEFLKDPRLPWSVKHKIIQIAFGPRCVLCDERRGQLCRIDDVYEVRCLTCVKQMLCLMVNLHCQRPWRMELFVPSGLSFRVPLAVLCEI